jgi:hypothetical protein
MYPQRPESHNAKEGEPVDLFSALGCPPLSDDELERMFAEDVEVG